MKVSEEDAQLFFNLMWSLQHYVNQKCGIHPEVRSVDEYSDLSLQEKAEVRQALYSDVTIIDSFLEDNPQDLGEEELAIAASWKSFVGGDFFVERFLEKYTILIQEEEVYGVLGLLDPIEEVVPTSVPSYINTVLLPFKGKIIYDGMMSSRGIRFGGNMREELKEIYMTAKQNRRIITTLDPEKREEMQRDRKKNVKDYSSELNQVAEIARKLRGGSSAPAIRTPAFKLVRESIKFAREAADNPKDVESLGEQLNKVNSTLRRCSRVIDRTEID